MCAVSTFIARVALTLLFLYVARAGIGALNPQFFRRPDPSHPELGGTMHAIVGTIELILMACTMGVPLGVLGGIYSWLSLETTEWGILHSLRCRPA